MLGGFVFPLDRMEAPGAGSSGRRQRRVVPGPPAAPPSGSVCGGFPGKRLGRSSALAQWPRLSREPRSQSQWPRGVVRLRDTAPFSGCRERRDMGAAPLGVLGTIPITASAPRPPIYDLRLSPLVLGDDLTCAL